MFPIKGLAVCAATELMKNLPNQIAAHLSAIGYGHGGRGGRRVYQ